MTPEEKLIQLEEQINDLQNQINSLKSYTTIPRDVSTAFNSYFDFPSFAKLSADSKTAGSETQNVNEAGALSYNVAKPMDGFFQFVKNNTTHHIPYYL